MGVLKYPLRSKPGGWNMVKLVVKTLEDTVKRWVEETPKRAAYYELYTPAAGKRWEEHTVGAMDTYKAAVTAIGIERRFAGGVRRVGAPKFVNKVKKVGIARFGPGIVAAEDYYKGGIDPFLKRLAEIDVPERKPRGDPANLKRVEVIFKELHELRLKRLAELIGMAAAS